RWMQSIVNTVIVFLARVAAFILPLFVREDLTVAVRFAPIIIFQILFSILGSIVVNAYSRHREFHADRGAAHFAGKDKMKHALKSLQQYTERAYVKDNTDDTALQTMNINAKGNMMNLFAYHPDINKRIKRLEEN